MLFKLLKLVAIALVVTLFSGCATQKGASFDYTAFKQVHPRSVVILPPLNDTTDVSATYGMMSQMTYPLAEAGYYVFPVALVDETFKQNGLTDAHDIQAVSLNKLAEIFGADTALYVTVKQYGSTYMVVDSITTVTATAKLVDLKSGVTIWQGAASANNNEGGHSSGGGLVGMLVAAAAKQIFSSTTDAAYPIAGITSQRLLSAGHANGILYGPYSDRYRTD